MTEAASQLGLVALDGSGTAEYILPWAAAFAQALRMRLLLLRFAEGDGGLGAASHYLEGVASALKARGIEVEVSARPAEGDTAAAIVNVADQAHVDLILMATHGRTGVSRLVLGSVADAVVRSARGAVLVVRAGSDHPGSEPAAVRRVLLTLDASPLAEAAIPYAGRYAQAFGAALDVIEVAPLAAAMFAGTPGVVIPDTLDKEIEQGAADYLRGIRAKLPEGVPVELHVLRGPAAAEILDYAEGTHADLIVMSTRGRSRVARWTLGSVADKVLRGGSIPVVLVHSAEEAS